ncbi:MAG: hypothetical protein IJW54_07530 [Clostridia bacterium]|nr:hypothetical protein [Clostridia bacterium]
MKNELIERCLPPLLSREKMIDILQREEYGYLPSVSYELNVSEPISVYGEYQLGNVEHSYVTMEIKTKYGSHSFRLDRLLHRDGKKRPLIIFNNFHPIYASRYFPIEEIGEREVDIVSCVYQDITEDNGDFTNGLAPVILPNGQNTDTSAGKIMIWAWANMRILDYALTLDTVEKDNIAIVGHSRLGKTALVTAMLDTRFKYVYTNAAGCSGDALSKGNSGHTGNMNERNRGELISDIVRVFPYWFCKNYQKYVEKNYSDEFDQHYLLATLCPRYVLVGICSHDLWADPYSQQLCLLSASEAWLKNGLDAFDRETPLEAGERDINTHTGCFVLKSRHYLSRHGWRNFIDFIERHK